MNDKGFRLDFAIAIGALFISTVTALASVYQSRVIAQQFSAAVWPYVSFDTTNSPTSVALDLRNDGMGPAIVRWVAISWDSKPVATIEAVVDKVTGEAQKAHHSRHHATTTFETSTPSVGLVIPANGQRPVIHVDGPDVRERFRPQLDRFDVSICYCSLTGTCWKASFKNRAGEPQNVAACPHA